VPDDTPLKPAAPPYPDNGSRHAVDAWIDAVMAPIRRAYFARQAALLHRIANLPPTARPQSLPPHLMHAASTTSTNPPS
jgi:hypothetical protein